MNFEEMFVATIVPRLREAVRDEVKAALLEVKPTTGEYLTVTEAARIAGVSTKTMRVWLKTKKLPTRNANGRKRVRRDDLEHFLSTPQASLGPATVEGAAAAVLASLRKV